MIFVEGEMRHAAINFLLGASGILVEFVCRFFILDTTCEFTRINRFYSFCRLNEVARLECWIRGLVLSTPMPFEW